MLCAWAYLHLRYLPNSRVSIGFCKVTHHTNADRFDIFCPSRPISPLLLYTASVEQGLRLSTPIISAGSFGLSCDYTLNLQRLLPPARKISDFFIKFWKYNNNIKPQWFTAFVYKKQSNTEDCFW